MGMRTIRWRSGATDSGQIPCLPMLGHALRGDCQVPTPIPSPFVPVLAGALVRELRTARENARLEIGSQRGRNSHPIRFVGICGL